MSLHQDIVEKEPKINRVMHNEMDVDIISTMPDGIITHIMDFLITQEAVQTCILSKRWKDLWKQLSTLNISHEHFKRADVFKFVNNLLKKREKSSVLRNIEVDHHGYVPYKLLRKMINYAVKKKVEKFKVGTYLRHRESNMLLFRSIFSLHSLKFLDLSFYSYGWDVKLPETIDLPELANCCLRHVTFTLADGNDYARPFLECKKLSTLVIDDCKVAGDDKILYISGDKLSSLSITYNMWNHKHLKVKISAPYLKSFTFKGNFTSDNVHQVIEQNMDFIEDACIIAFWNLSHPNVVETIKNILKRIRNVHSLTLSWNILQVLEISGALMSYQINHISICYLLQRFTNEFVH